MTEDLDVENIARRYQVSSEAVLVLLAALRSGGGRMAQFNHPELGGMGQWSSGMLMIGDFSNSELKAKVLAICGELAQSVASSDRQSSAMKFKEFETDKWWPDELGMPGSAGAQNEIRYAYFPSTNRLAIKENSAVTIFDTGDHKIYGVSQQQGLNTALVFESQLGRVSAADLQVVERL